MTKADRRALALMTAGMALAISAPAMSDERTGRPAALSSRTKAERRAWKHKRNVAKASRRENRRMGR